MILQRLQSWWTGLARRERVMVIATAAVVSLGILFAAGIEPAWTTRARLAVEIPRLQSELVQLEALRTEAQRLAGKERVGQTLDALLTAVEESVLRSNLSATASVDDGTTVSVVANDVPAAAWFAWLETFSRESRTPIAVAMARRTDEAGRIDAFVSFRLVN